jgi:hypothetical protein
MLRYVFNLVFIQELLEIDCFGYRLFCDLLCMHFPLKWGFGVFTVMKMKISLGMLWCAVWYQTVVVAVWYWAVVVCSLVPTTKAYGITS